MQAIISEGYGTPDTLELRTVDRPPPEPGQVLVRVRAAAVNPLDWHILRGEPYLLRLMGGLRAPGVRVSGVDAAGVVEEVGENVTGFSPGDEVFGGCAGAFAELALAKADALAAKPASLTFEQAAAIPIAGCTALQALRDKGRLKAGQSVLLIGAAGGVGTFAVQIAKAFGAEVTGVCSTPNLELVQSIGADHVVDYRTEDFAGGSPRYDLIVQIAGDRTLRDLRRALKPDGTLVVVGSGVGREVGGGSLGPLGGMLNLLVRARFTKQRLVMFIAKVRSDDLVTLAQLCEEGKLTPVIDRTYELSAAADAIRQLEAGHVRGKVVLTVPG